MTAANYIAGISDDQHDDATISPHDHRFLPKQVAERSPGPTVAEHVETLGAVRPLPRLPVLARDAGGKHTTVAAEVIDDAKFHDLAGLILKREYDTRTLATRVGMSQQLVRKTLRSDRFRLVYERLRDDFISHRTDYILNESVSADERLEECRTRGITAVSEIIEEVRDRVRGKAAKATEMKVGVDAAIALMDRSPSGRKQAAAPTFIFAPTLQQAQIIRDADTEAFNMADVQDAEVVLDQPGPPA